MYTIGEFSVITKIPKKTLRYYDEINLFKPFTKDEYTGYRYYNQEQTEYAEKIVMYKNFGLSLEDIKILISGKIPENDILERRKNEINYEIKKLLQQKERIENKDIFENKNNEAFCENSYLSGGEIFSFPIDQMSEDINVIIGKFYDEIASKKIIINSQHIIKYNIDENENNISEIFAYAQKSNFTEYFKGSDTIKLICPDFHYKNRYYIKLFEKAKEKNVKINSFAEKYRVVSGKMITEIFACFDN